MCTSSVNLQSDTLYFHHLSFSLSRTFSPDRVTQLRVLIEAYRDLDGVTMKSVPSRPNRIGDPMALLCSAVKSTE